MKFEEMEEKMRRQKMKGAHKNTESEENENVVKTEDAETVTVRTQTMSIQETDSTEMFDHPEQYVSTTSLPLMEPVTLAMSEEPTYTQIQRVPSPPPPRTVVESERLHLVEIKSDGTSGHLVRLPSGGYEEQ